MTKEKTSLRNHINQILLYGCGLILFLEWLYPVEEVTDTSGIAIFVIYTVFCFFISFLGLKGWISFLLKGVGLLFILNGLYFHTVFLSPAWLRTFYVEIISNIEIVISQNWVYLSPFFRSFLFLLLIWLMSYLLYYWFVQMKRIFLFIVLTFVYISVLDTFTAYDATFAVIRIFIISLIALFFTNLNRFLEKEKLSFRPRKWKARWIFPLIVTISLSLLLGIAAPKKDPQWPDPVPYMGEIFEQTNGKTVQKVGYGEDDSQLGGSFIQDDTPVFLVEANQESYWRMETKEVYTGKGWENGEDSLYVEKEPPELSISSFAQDVNTVKREASIQFLEGQNFDKLVYPYGMKGITDASHPVEYVYDEVSESVETRMNGKGFEIDHYQVTYDDPSFSLNRLKEEVTWTEDVSRYLQLPESLPERVGELAEEITKAHESQYDKVRAIERYFGRNDFSYETTGVAVPSGNEDYVDQFLFETQIGYCDNFSTAMVVMLRTLEIPARWAKGFAGGEKIEEIEEKEKAIYEVTNANAHSWVEVYFPEVGWVPFEPTQGFSNLTEFHLERTDTGSDSLEYSEREEQAYPGLENEGEETVDAMAEPMDPQAGDTNSFWQIGEIFIGLLILFLGSYFGYKHRFHLLSLVHLLKWRQRGDEQTFHDAYQHLLAVLTNEGYEREKNETLREYAKRVDGRFETNAMQEFTHYYERMLYRKEYKEENLDILKGLWKQLIQMIRG